MISVEWQQATQNRALKIPHVCDACGEVPDEHAAMISISATDVEGEDRIVSKLFLGAACVEDLKKRLS